MASTEPCQGSNTGSIPVQDSISAGTRIGIALCLRNKGLWVRVPPCRLIYPPIAQLAEHLTLNQGVLGSIPSGRTRLPVPPESGQSVNMDFALKLPPTV